MKLSNMFAIVAICSVSAFSGNALADDPFLGKHKVDFGVGHYDCAIWINVSGDTVRVHGWEHVVVNGKKKYEDKKHTFFTVKGRDAFKKEYDAGAYGKVTIEGSFVQKKGHVYIHVDIFYSYEDIKLAKVAKFEHQIQ